MKKLFALLFVLILSFGLVSSFNFNNLSCQTILLGKSSIIGFEIPDKVPFSDEIFNVYISDNFFIELELKSKIIENVTCTENKDATYDILIKDYSVLEKFIKSDDFLTTFLEAKDSKDIQIVGKSFGKKTKMFFVNIGIKIFSWFH